MSDVKVITYETLDPIHNRERYCAFLLLLVAEVDSNRKKTGNQVYSRLPMVFFGESSARAASAALKFWNDERLKAEAKKERGKALGLRKKEAA